MPRRPRLLGRPFVAGLLLFAWSAARGENTGLLRGLVIDAHGAPLPGVAVALSGGGPGPAGRGAVTDTAGMFQIAALPPAADYQVLASFPGLAADRLHVVITAGRTTPVRII